MMNNYQAYESYNISNGVKGFNSDMFRQEPHKIQQALEKENNILQQVTFITSAQY